jgi:NhaP-type Na+/H+ or K+/H+ antiporter
MEYNAIIGTVIITLAAGSVSIVLCDRFRFPAILLYFFWGIALGPYGAGLIRPDSLGEGLTILITLFVCIILFEGGLSLDISRLKSIRIHLTRQILLTIVITMTASWLAAVYIAVLPPDLALIFASLTIVTGPTVIKPIVRHLPVRRRVITFLNGEAVIIDAVGAVLAIAIIEYFVSQKVLDLTILGFVVSIIAGVSLGAAFGVATRLLLTKTPVIPVTSRSILTLGLVFLVYYISELMASESGLMAVAVFGIVLSTIDYRDREKLLSFKEQITRIVISLLFILLAASFDISLISEEVVAGLLVSGVIIAARFPAVLAGTAGGMFSLRERLFMAWVGPRGIIALSVASIAAIKLTSAGIEKAEIIEMLVFMLISVTVLLQGMSAGLVARRMGILVEGDRNIIILGINPTTIGMAKYWRSYQNDVLFVDSNRSNCMLAEKEGFPYLHGNGVSADTFLGVDVDHYSSVLAATPNIEINILFCRFVKKTYGISRLYVILTEKAGDKLGGIIESEGIRTACIGVQARKAGSLFTIIRDYLFTTKPVIREVTVTSESFLQNRPGEYPIPENIFILFVARKEKSCHVFHDGFKLETRDALHVVMDSDTPENELDPFTRP